MNRTATTHVDIQRAWLASATIQRAANCSSGTRRQRVDLGPCYDARVMEYWAAWVGEGKANERFICDAEDDQSLV